MPKLMKKFEYDPVAKVLKIRFRDGDSIDSDVIENLVLDYNESGELVKMDIMDVNLEELISLEGINQEILKQ